ncbi:MAG: gamma-glutamyl-gamma-aminobutyrate hydrolase family protein [Lachnospiraceae bacterium]|nr:gamma-glutamyl-gamma-aminobutyrate hydrolase family protein [Lachnospiraceae bacterium]
MSKDRIYRGIQVLNVAARGSLYQDLEKEGRFGHHFMDMYAAAIFAAYGLERWKE